MGKLIEILKELAEAVSGSDTDMQPERIRIEADRGAGGRRDTLRPGRNR